MQETNSGFPRIFPAAFSQPHPQGAPRADVMCTTTVLFQWNLARGAYELQSRLEYVPVPFVIPRKRSGMAKTNTAQLRVTSAGNWAATCSERHPTSESCQPGHGSREPAATQGRARASNCIDQRKPARHQLCPPQGAGTRSGKICGAGCPQAAQPKRSPKFPTPGRAGAFPPAPGRISGLCPVPLAKNTGLAAGLLATEQTDVPRTASGSNGRLVG